MTNMYFQVASFFYMLMILILFFSKKRIANIETKIFSWLSIINMIGILLDILIVYLSYVRPGIAPLYILNKFYLLYIVYWVCLFCFYIANIPTKKKKKKRIIKKVAMMLAVLFTIVVLCVPIYLFNENNVMYTYGPSCTATYIAVAIYVIIMIVAVGRNIRNIMTKKYMPIVILLMLSFLGLIVRRINPGLLLTTTIITYINILMYHTIENPDVKMIEQLNSAKEAAEKANRAKTDFLSSMSHEIRTPLNAIVGFSECILKEEDLESVKSDAKDIIMASQNLLEIVNGVLDISKIEADKMEIIETEYNLRENLESLSKLMIPRIGEKPIEFKTKFAPDIPATLYGDISKIKQIITNILTNAVKYTERGIITFEVNCINHNTSCSLVISVEDTGRGIPADKIDCIFNKFERLEEDRNTTLEGTGLGLAITKRLVEMMGGKIVVQSKYGEGSKFTVYLKQKIRNSVAKKSVPPFVSIENMNLSSKRVLVVDDNRINLKVATRMLQPFKIMVEECESGDACLSKIREGRKYDLILMDDMMPKMTGTETLQELKKDSSFHTPVVVLTANAIEGMRAKYLNLGFTDYLAKPIDKSELERILGQYLSTNVQNDIFGPLPEELFDMTIPLKKDE